MSGLNACLTELDVVRIETMLAQVRRNTPAERESIEALEERVDAADVVHSRSVERYVVTMNSTVELADVESGTTTTVTLVYPQEASADRSRVSILSPVGRALLGARVGDVIRVVVPGQPDAHLRVAALPFQPEASGRYDL